MNRPNEAMPGSRGKRYRSVAPGGTRQQRGFGSITRICLLTGVLGLSGCGGSVVIQKDHYYRIRLPTATAASRHPLEASLLVKRFRGDSLVTQRPIVYAEKNRPETLMQYNYHFWSDTPTAHLQELAVDYLRDSGIAPLVHSSDLDVDSRYELTGQIRELEHLRTDKDPQQSGSSVKLGIEYALLDNRSRTVVLLRRYSSEQLINPTDAVAEKQENTRGSDDLHGAVIAFGNAYQQILQSLVADIDARPRVEKALAQGPPSKRRP